MRGEEPDLVGDYSFERLTDVDMFSRTANRIGHRTLRAARPGMRNGTANAIRAATSLVNAMPCGTNAR
ncbi:hypothetical protein ACIHDR_38990 [Nocardia sp. NPDC052278]|uniref:hypothetical protein n=1 Tax=unclassified Nocardia TaxID=2637762 RepID=UPI0036929FA4